MFTVVSVTLGRDRLVSDSTLVFAPNVLRFPKVVPDAALDEPDRSIRNFCTFQTDAKNFWWEGKTRFLVLDGTQHRLPLTSEMTDIFFPDSPSKYILKILFVHYNLILWLYVRVCPTPALLQSLLRRLLFPAFVAPAITTWTPLRSRSPRLSSFRCRSISACRSLTDTSTMRGSAQTQRHYKIHCCPLFP